MVCCVCPYVLCCYLAQRLERMSVALFGLMNGAKVGIGLGLCKGMVVFFFYLRVKKLMEQMGNKR